MLKKNKDDEIKEFAISDDVQRNLPEILTTFFDDISHIMATSQSYFENAILGSALNQSIGDSMHTFTVGATFLRQLSGRIDTFRNVVKYGRQVLPQIRADSFFNPGDLNQEIGDMLSIYASSRHINIILENPCEHLVGDVYLAFYDLDFLRQILLQFVSSMIGLAQHESDLQLRLLVTDIQSESLLTPEMGHYLSASIRSRMKMIFQVKYEETRKLDRTNPLDGYYIKILKSKEGFIKSYKIDSHNYEELHLPCYAIQFENVVKTVGYYEIPGQMPYTLVNILYFNHRTKECFSQAK